MNIDWEALEAEVELASARIPAMGDAHRTARSCSGQLGQLWCAKPHDLSRDPVHVSAHRDYGVIAVWSEEGGPPQVNMRLFERVGPLGMCWLLGSLDPGTIVLASPRQENA